MRLSEIKATITEGRVDPNVLLSIDRLIQAGGKKPDTFQLMALARTMTSIKEGYFYKEPNFWEVTHGTDKALLDVLRNMPADELSTLAVKLRELLDIKDRDLLYQYANPTQEALAWIKWVSSREAND